VMVNFEVCQYCCHTNPAMSSYAIYTHTLQATRKKIEYTLNKIL